MSKKSQFSLPARNKSIPGKGKKTHENQPNLKTSPNNPHNNLPNKYKETPFPQKTKPAQQKNPTTPKNNPQPTYKSTGIGLSEKKRKTRVCIASETRVSLVYPLTVVRELSLVPLSLQDNNLWLFPSGAGSSTNKLVILSQWKPSARTAHSA